MMKTIFLKYITVLFVLIGFVSCDEYVRRDVEKNIYVNMLSLNLFVEDEIQLIASPSDGTYEYRWKSENTDIATVDDNGLVKVISEGYTDITVSSGNIQTKIPLTALVRIPLQNVELSDTYLEMLPGQAKTILVTLIPDNTNDIPSDSWTSEDESIVTVNASGALSIVREGVTTITYRIGDIVKTLTVDAAYTRSFLGPHILSANAPYELPAANFDTGGEGFAFHDDATIRGNTYRQDNGDNGSPQVDIEGKGVNIGNIAVGEWLVYTIEVEEPGDYRVEVSLSARYDGSSFHLELDNENVTGTVTIPSNNSWNAWRWFTTPSLVLNFTEGRHRIKFYVEGYGFNLRAFRFTKI